MTDRFGKTLKVGDKVATPVLRYRRAEFKVTTIKEIISFGLSERASLKGLPKWRDSIDLIKV